MDENGVILQKARNRQYPVEISTDAEYAEDFSCKYICSTQISAA